jgi:hypothetical protein
VELLERYLFEIRRHLDDSEQRDDILAEISDEVQSRIEARAEKLGRPATSEDLAPILADYGHPRLVAFRHLPQRSLIGPLLYPFYIYTLRIVSLTFVILVMIGAALAALVSLDPLSSFLSGIGLLWPAILYPIAVITVMFAIAERLGGDETLIERVVARGWDPEMLPRPETERLSPVHLLIEAFVLIVGALWLLGEHAVRQSLGITAAGAVSNGIVLGAAWHWFFVALFFATGLIVVADILLATRPAHVRVRFGVLIAANAIYVIATAAIIPAVPNNVILGFLAAFGLICVAQVITNVRSLAHRSKTPPLNIAHA